MLSALARRTARQIEKLSLLYAAVEGAAVRCFPSEVEEVVVLPEVVIAPARRVGLAFVGAIPAVVALQVVVAVPRTNAADSFIAAA